MAEFEVILRRLERTEKKLNDLTQLITAKLDTVIKPKWVSKDVAMEISGLCERALMDRTVLRDPVNGKFHVNRAGKEYRFYLKDLEAYVLENSTLPGGKLVQMIKKTA
jgi:hypothetical protein